MNWLESLYSEVNEDFLSNPFPVLGEKITVSMRCFRQNGIKRAFLRTVINGGTALIPMTSAKQTERFVYYRCSLKISQRWLSYHFIIESEEGTWYFFNRREVTEYHPTEDHDWVLIADFENPEWIRRSVFYQIFPDRFANGNPDNDVQSGAYTFDGHETKKLSWNEPAPRYEEGWCLDFYGGDLEGIRKKIPYLKELGVSALYLNPIFSSRTNHGYDCIDYFHVADHFGGDQALRELVEELHSNGMKIILDVSINHTGSEHPWFRRALKNSESDERDFYYIGENNNYAGWAGVDTLPQLNYSSEKLRELIIRGRDSLVRHYLRSPFNTDGWRFDVGNNTGMKDEHQFSHEIFREVRKAVKETNPDSYIIGEHWEYNIGYHLGDQWDGAMNYFASGRPLRVFAGEIDHFLEGVAGKGRSKVPGSGINLAVQIEQHFTRLPNYHAYLQFNLLDSHDIHRFHNNSEVFDEDIHRGMLFILFLLPGTPSIYYGDEIGLDGYIDTVEGCRFSMSWDEAGWNRSRFDLYRSLAGLKRSEPALHDGGFRVLFADRDTMAFARFNSRKGFIGIISKNETNKTVELPVAYIGGKDGTDAEELFSSERFPVHEGTLPVKLPPKGNMLLTLETEA